MKMSQKIFFSTLAAFSLSSAVTPHDASADNTPEHRDCSCMHKSGQDTQPGHSGDTGKHTSASSVPAHLISRENEETFRPIAQVEIRKTQETEVRSSSSYK